MHSVHDIDPIGLPDLVEFREEVLNKSVNKSTTRTQLGLWWRACSAAHRSHLDGMAYLPSIKQKSVLTALYHNGMMELPRFLTCIEKTIEFWPDWVATSQHQSPTPDILTLYNQAPHWYEWAEKNIPREPAE